MTCPSCGAVVEDGADLCLECGEPMGDSPAAKLARTENVIRPPSDAFAPTTKPANAPTKPASAPPPSARPTAVPPTRPASAPPPPSPTIPAKPAAKRKWAAEEPEPLRCPGCGVKSHAERCPNCGNKLKHDED